MDSVARSLGRLSAKWLLRTDPWRRKALRAMRRDFPGEMGEKLLDALFSELTEKKLARVLRSDPGPFRGARGGLAVHVVPANVPNPAVTALVLGLLAGADNAVKLPRRDSGLFRVYLDSLRAHDPGLARKTAVFSSRTEALRRMKRAALVSVYGTDETVALLGKHVPAGTPLVAHGHKVSVGVFAKEPLSPRLARAAAYDAWMLDRRGCMSPETFFVEDGGRIGAREFAELLEREIAALHRKSGVSFGRALRLKAARDRERLKALKDGPSAFGTVRAFRSRAELSRLLRPYRGKLQVAALEASGPSRRRLEALLLALGASRICRAGRMQHPPLAWTL